MRNSSDIFCLNENVSDGYGMFSINGSCPMKLKRRHQNSHNDCFEFGQTKTDKYSGDLKAEKADLEQLLDSPKELDEAQGIDDGHIELSGEESQIEHSAKDVGQRTTNFKKIEDRKIPEGISTSSMSRNPLTGAGMETSPYRRPKKRNPNQAEKWAW